MSLSRNGEFLAVGGPGDQSGVGATWVFHFDGSSYKQIGSKLVGTNSIGNDKRQGKGRHLYYISYRGWSYDNEAILIEHQGMKNRILSVSIIVL